MYLAYYFTNCWLYHFDDENGFQNIEIMVYCSDISHILLMCHWQNASFTLFDDSFNANDNLLVIGFILPRILLIISHEQHADKKNIIFPAYVFFHYRHSFSTPVQKRNMHIREILFDFVVILMRP